MDIAGVSVLKNIPVKQPQQNTNDGKLGSFAGIMASIHAADAPIEGQNLQQTEEMEKILAELAEFLLSGDLADLENGVELLENSSTDAKELFQIALDYFGLENEQIKGFLEKWPELTGNGEIQEDDLTALSSFIAQLSGQPQSELAARLENQDAKSIKALKLYDLMMKYTIADGKENNDLKDALQSLGKKLMQPKVEKMDNLVYLQNRFTRLAAELNLAATKMMPVSENTSEGPGLKPEGSLTGITFMPHMAKAEQLTLMMNSPERPVSAEQLIKQFESILAKSQFMSSGGTQKLLIKLYPEHLGSVRVEIFQKDQSMIARIITSSGAARDTLDSQLGNLKQAFAAQNIPVDRIEVSQQNTQQERFLSRDTEQQQRQPDRQAQEKKEENDEFALSFEEALLNTEA